MSLSANELVDTLVENRLIDAGQLDDITPEMRKGADGLALAKQFVEWNWLTPYQVEVIFSGNAESLLFGDYRLLEHLGTGGMGNVYKAAHLRLNRMVALKMIRAQSMRATSNSDELVRRFQREAQAVAQLLHPNIVILFDYNEFNDTHFIAMEYVDGVDLMKMVQTQGPLSVPHACDYIRQAANGLQHAFEFGMVHRDIKPSNLLVTRPSNPVNRYRGPKSRDSDKHLKPGDTPLPVPRGNAGGVVKILDLGLVRFSESLDDHDTLTALTMQGSVIGTPDYIAPEQARDASKVDIRADLYSLGCTFYFLLTGRAPFPNGTSVEKLFQHQNETAMPLEQIRPGIPAEVTGIVQRLMSKKPDSRFQTPAELSDAIAALPSAVRTGKAKMENGGKIITASAQLAAVERPLSHIDEQTQMFSPESLILPAKKLAVLQGHQGYVTALEFSPDGRYLATGGLDGSVRLWDVGMARPQEKPLDQNQGLGEIHHLKFSPNGKTLYAGSTAMDGHNWRWEWTGPHATARSRFVNDEYRTGCFAVSPDGKTIAAGSLAAVLLYDATGRKPTIFKGHSNEVCSLAYSPNGKRLYSAGADKNIVMWEPGRFWNAQRAVFQGHKDTIVSLDSVPDGSLLASASIDGTIKLWDAAAEVNEPVATLAGNGHSLRKARFVGNGSLLVSVADGGQVCLWEVTQQAIVREWQIDRSILHSVAISADGRFLATGINDGQVVFYDLELLAMQRPLQQVA
jgi:serine/threonine-protein kinase